MNKYLLLRDNKQSGPYSVSELASHGLKAYDLVWLEGRSAAWRYPSEIEELQPFAPIVEEQPFDRFYKKSESKSSEAPKQITRNKEAYSPKAEEIRKPEPISPSNQNSQVSLSNGVKKIHVSLPGGIKPVEPLPVKLTTDETKPAHTPLVTEKSKPVSQPLYAEKPVVNASQLKAEAIQEQENFEEAYRQSKSKKQAGPVPKEAPVSKLLFRFVAAACLLLGGALIGLIINYNSQQQKFQQLNQLVEEIKQQDNPGSSKVAKNDNLAVQSLPANTANEETLPAVEQPVYKEDIQLPPRKEKNSQKHTKNNVDTTSQVIVTPEATPEVSKNEEAAKRMDKLASETAKKNLWQLVTVNHNNYKTGVFGGVSNLSLKLSNRSLFQLQQVEVEVLFLSPEKKTVNKQKVVFENVAPGEQLSIDIPKSNRGVKVDYVIKKISTKEFELAHAGM